MASVTVVKRKRGRPRRDPDTPPRTLRPKARNAETDRVSAFTDEALEIQAARLVKHRSICRERYHATRRGIREIFLPLLLRKKPAQQQTNTLDVYSRDNHRDTVEAVGGVSGSQHERIFESDPK
jgi:hypothetical protein